MWVFVDEGDQAFFGRFLIGGGGAEFVIAASAEECGEDAGLLDQYERQRRQIAIDFINANTARNKKNIEERDPDARRKTQNELRAIAASPSASKEYLRKISMIDALERAESIL